MIKVYDYVRGDHLRTVQTVLLWMPQMPASGAIATRMYPSSPHVGPQVFLAIQ